MSDPQDLLYTNKFIDTDIITSEQIKDDVQYYDRYINYLNKNPENEIQNYLNKNLNESDLVNIQQTIDNPWPINNKKNRYPLLSDISSDISKNRYTQEIVSQFSINSDDRNYTYYPYSTEFKFNLPKKMNNVKGIEILNISLPNFTNNINNMNNVFSWQFFSNYYKNYVCSFNIIPYNDINKKISYFSLPYSTYMFNVFDTGVNYNPELYLTYQLNIPTANYDIDVLLNNIKILSKNVLHGSFNYNQSLALGNKSQSRVPDQQLPPLMEEPYQSFEYMRYTPNLWDFDYSLQNEVLFSVNRMEEIPVYSFQTFSQTDDISTYNWSTYDVFYNYSSNPGNLDPKYIYITVPYIENVSNYWYHNPIISPNNPFVPSAFPLVFTNLSSYNDDLNIFMRNLNFTEFYDLNIYLLNPKKYTEDELKNICYYKFNDIIIIPNNTVGKHIKLIRFALRYNSSGQKGKKFDNTIPIELTPIYNYYKPSQTITLIYNSLISNLIQNNVNTAFTSVSLYPLCGRALLTRFIFDIDNGIYTHYISEDSYEKKRTFLDLLGMSIANQTSAFLVSNFNNGFSFVHTTRSPQILDINLPTIYYNVQPLINNLISPQTSLNYTIKDGKYYLSKNPYVYIQIFFINNNANTIVEDYNIQTNQDSYNISINQNYSNDIITSVMPIGIPINCLDVPINIRSKNNTNIIAKILNSEVPGNLDNINNNINKQSIFYAFTKIIDDINTIQINILDSEYKIIQSNKNVNMILKIYQDIHKLKETNINTKTNNIDIIGNIK